MVGVLSEYLRIHGDQRKQRYPSEVTCGQSPDRDLHCSLPPFRISSFRLDRFAPLWLGLGIPVPSPNENTCNPASCSSLGTKEPSVFHASHSRIAEETHSSGSG